ncbi:MAG: DUF1631 family protein, partial [Methylococcaceae bacterium]|nr:DUF1631 family protein [Methylococcaceae bacterium]
MPFSDCEIRDYCEGGLYLTFDYPIDPSRAPIESVPSILVRFDATIHGKQETIQANVKPVRLTASGLGVRFVQPGEKVLDALQNLTIPGSGTACAKAIPATVGPGPVPAYGKVQFEEEVQRTVARILREFFETMDPALRIAAERADSNRLASIYRDAVSQLTEKRSCFERSYSQSVRAQLYPGQSPCANITKPAGNKANFALVDKDDFEDWLILSEIINKANTSHENILSEIDKKIAALNGHPSGNRYQSTSPAVLCELFREQLDEYGLDHRVKQHIYKIFGRSLENQLGSFYRVLNQHLEPIGLSAARNHSESVAEKVPASSENRTRVPLAGAGPQTRRKAGLIDRFRAFHRLLVSEGMIGQENTRPSTDAGNPVAPTSIAKCSSSQILTVLRKLAASHDANREPIIGFREIESEILREVADPLSLAASSADDRFYIDFAARFYDTLAKQSADLAIADSILHRLRVPFLNLAARDPDFLDDRGHAAWQILDLIGHLNSSLYGYAESKEGEIRQALDTFIGRFSANSDANRLNLETIRDELKNTVTAMDVHKARSVERIREICAGRQQIKKAKVTVQERIDDRIAGKPVPQTALSLLDGGWEQLLTLSILRGGADNESFESRLQLFDRVLNLLSEPAKLESEPTRELRHLLHRIDENLSLACGDLFQHNAIMNDLAAHLLGVGDPPVRTPVVMALAPARSPQRTELQNLPFDLRDFANQAKELNVDDWLMFNLHDMDRQPLNLVWKGEDPWLFVFVNRKGKKVIELSLQSLATFLKQERVWKIESLDIPLSERTFSAMLQDMHVKLIRRSTLDERTGLINRKGFQKQLKQEFAALRDERPGHYVCIFEIDQIHWISGACDVDAVDSVLGMVIDMVRSTLGAHDLLAQLGDQKFGILYKSIPADRTTEICENLRTAITSLTFDWKEHSFPLGLSIGLAPFVRQSQGLSAVLAHADRACMAAKSAGHNQIQIYLEDSDELRMQDRIYHWAGRIRKVIEQNRLLTRAQLIAPINPSAKTQPHYEILLGVQDESGNMIPPADFIQAAEYCGRISEIDRWVVSHVFEWMESNPDKMKTIDGFSINLSGHSIVSEDFLEFTRQQLTSRKINAEKITFEVTETA